MLNEWQQHYCPSGKKEIQVPFPDVAKMYKKRNG